MVDLPEAKQAKQRYTEFILTKPNVVGVGTGYKVTKGEQTDEISIVVLVRRKLGGLDESERIPRMIAGVKTDVFQVGELRALQDPKSRHRPAPGGVSIGHYRITAGTLGAAVRDLDSGARLILSNNHVLANSNQAEAGDPIIQPGAADGGRLSEDTIALLERFIPIEFYREPGKCSFASLYAAIGNFLARLLGSSHRLHVRRTNPQAVNLVDAALARPINDSDLSDHILEIGQVSGTAPAHLGMTVRKFGRTTGFTSGQVLIVEATVTVNYGGGRSARFDDQIITGPISKGGDSGSLVVDGSSPRAVGLLFAGSDQTTILNPIEHVLQALQVEI